MNERELATTLAALRYWQQDMIDIQDQDEDNWMADSTHFEKHQPLTVEEIDALCEKLNAPESEPHELVRNLRAWAEKFQKDNYFAYSGLITLAHKFEKAFESK
jgi:hypothetical protein